LNDEPRDKTAESRSEVKENEINSHPPAALVKEKQICIQSGRQAFCDRCGKGTGYTGSNQICKGSCLGRPNYRAKEKKRGTDEGWPFSKIEGCGNPEEVLSKDQSTISEQG